MKHGWLIWAALALACPAYAQVVVAPGGPNGVACAYNASPTAVASGQAVWQQCDSLGHPLTVAVSPQGISQGITAAGNAARVSQEPTQLFWDDFGTGTLDTTSKWTAPTTGGGGNATTANNQVGATALGSGTSPSGWSILSSQYTFTGKNPSWLYFQEQNNFEFPVLTHAARFWGFATFPAAPTAAAPYADAVGFELGTDGHLRAVTSASPGSLAAGTKTVIADLSVACVSTNPYGGPLGLTTATSGCSANLIGKVAQPQDSGVHKYIIYFRGDNIYWAIDGIDSIVAFTINGAPGPNVNSLPVGHIAVADGTGPSSSAVISVNATTVGDTGRNEIRICDPVNPWRCATVGANGGLFVGASTSTTMSTAAPTALTFSSILAANALRKSCTIQNNSPSIAYIYFGTTGSATTGNSFQLTANGGNITCTTPTGTVLNDNVAATCANGTCAFVIGAQ